MKIYNNCELIQVQFNTNNLEWSFDMIFGNSGNSKTISCSELEAKTIIKDFENKIKQYYNEEMKTLFFVVEIQ